MLKIKIQEVLDGVQAEENPPSDPMASVGYGITACGMVHFLIIKG